MNNATIKTLTPVHIGTGKLIQGNAEYVYFRDDNQIALVDEKKVLDLIGVKQLPIWMNCIEKGENFYSYLKQRKSNLEPYDIATRVINHEGRIYPKSRNDLREQMHTALGNPYIPGSSLKGAIRTAFFSQSMYSEYGKYGIRNDEIDLKRKWGSNRKIQRAFFGEDMADDKGNHANYDWFRLLRVGDFNFNKGVTETCFVETINQYNKSGDFHYKIKNQLKQLIEYIPQGCEGEGRINFNSILWKASQGFKQRDRNRSPIFKEQAISLDLRELLSYLTRYTKALIDEELKRFEEMYVNDEAEKYLDHLEAIYEIAQECDVNEAVVRLGWGTGFLNMTGDWAESILNKKQKQILSDTVREKFNDVKNRRQKYQDFALPKTRRIINGGIPLGFIKITINE